MRMKAELTTTVRMLLQANILKKDVNRSSDGFLPADGRS
jgi:hypothetical protein